MRTVILGCAVTSIILMTVGSVHAIGSTDCLSADEIGIGSSYEIFVGGLQDLSPGLWLYEESNGIGGIQRGGTSAVIPGDVDPCVYEPQDAPDTLIL